MNILIVESKAKSKTIQRYLGRADWRVLSTGGHIRELPCDRAKHDRKEVRKAYWSSRGESLPDPPWVWSERGEAAVQRIRDEAAKHPVVTFYLASDPDREGERIAWHLERQLRDLGPCHRVTFQEVTQAALQHAIANPRPIEQDRVDAALVRVFIDRLVGWRASKQARSGVGRGGMGRVQTPVLGFIVERELEREAHQPIPYFEVRAFTDDQLPDLRWRVRLHDPRSADAWRGDDGRVDAFRTHDQRLAQQAHDAIAQVGALLLRDLRARDSQEQPPAPFRTDTLLRAASSRFGWSPKKTAKLASDLYEAGLISYIRTDSTRLSGEAQQAARAVVEQTWGQPMLGPGPRADKQDAQIQDAHEAIRPTTLERTAGQLPEGLDDSARRLYALVRGQTLAAFMVPAIRRTLHPRATVPTTEIELHTRVRWYVEPGWRRALASVDGEPDTTPASLEPGSLLKLRPTTDAAPNPVLIADQTRPPARYTPAAIIKRMRDTGIGRPSTYASTVDRLISHRFVVESEGLEPTDSGRHIWLEVAPRYGSDASLGWFSVETTATLEDRLDRIARGDEPAGATWIDLRARFSQAHVHAQQAAKASPLSPRTRQALEDYVAATPALAVRVGDRDRLTEAQGRELRNVLKNEGRALPPTAAQRARIERLLSSTEITLERACAQAKLGVTEPTTRDHYSALIDLLGAAESEHPPMSARQERLLRRLIEKSGMSEAEACALVGAESLADLVGGRGGTASALIDRLKS